MRVDDMVVNICQALPSSPLEPHRAVSARRHRPARPGRRVIENKVSTNVGSRIYRPQDVGKCSQVYRPPRTLSACLYEQLH